MQDGLEYTRCNPLTSKEDTRRIFLELKPILSSKHSNTYKNTSNKKAFIKNESG